MDRSKNKDRQNFRYTQINKTLYMDLNYPEKSLFPQNCVAKRLLVDQVLTTT
jgi:hypothetical protein